MSRPWTRRPPVLVGAGIGVVGFGVLLGTLVVRFTGPAPPDPMSGMPGMPGMPGMADPSATGGLTAASAAEGRGRPITPGMLDGMLRAAHASLEAERYPEAIAAYQAVLKREPRNVEAITHLGVILALAGHTDDALAAFDRALTIHPSYVHALWDRARILHELRQDFAAAASAWERVLEVLPAASQDRERAVTMLREAQTRLGATSSPPAPARSGPEVPSTSSGSTPGGAHGREAGHGP